MIKIEPAGRWRDRAVAEPAARLTARFSGGLGPRGHTYVDTAGPAP